MRVFFVRVILLSIFFDVAPAYAGIDCNTNCESWAGFNYPCPNLRTPRKMCKGTEPTSYAACSAGKVASCQMWNQAVDVITDKIKPMLIDSFNSQTWSEAIDHGETSEYMIKCEAAFIAAAAALGAQLGGPWGAAVTGGVGTFVGFQICNQSTKW